MFRWICILMCACAMFVGLDVAAEAGFFRNVARRIHSRRSARVEARQAARSAYVEAYQMAAGCQSCSVNVAPVAFASDPSYADCGRSEQAYSDCGRSEFRQPVEPGSFAPPIQ